MASLAAVRKLAIERRELRWERERAARLEDCTHNALVVEIAKWKGVDPRRIKMSNICCGKAPADLHCVFVESANPLTNPCVFCGGMEEDIY